MKFYRISTFVLLFLSICKSYSQDKITENQLLWFGYITQSKIADNLSWWNDVHWVPESFGLARTGLTYHFGKKNQMTTTFGYAFGKIYPPEGNETFRPEHRLWGQTTLSHKHNDFSFLHRLRYEGRFRGKIIEDHLQNEFNFNYRIRYLLQARYYFKNQEKGKFYLMASDEALFNVGHEIKNNFRLDQNRISFGVGYQLKQMTFQAAYMNQMIESNTNYTFKMNHNLQILVFHNFDLRKKSKTN